jgi:hypothetical protein
MEGERELFLSLGEELRVEHITRTGATLCVHIVSIQRASHCPLCDQASKQIHSHYQRVVADVPCGSKPGSPAFRGPHVFVSYPNLPPQDFHRAPSHICRAFISHDKPFARNTPGIGISHWG